MRGVMTYYWEVTASSQLRATNWQPAAPTGPVEIDGLLHVAPSIDESKLRSRNPWVCIVETNPVQAASLASQVTVREGDANEHHDAV